MDQLVLCAHFAGETQAAVGCLKIHRKVATAQTTIS